jgi:hypothetical protein
VSSLWADERVYYPLDVEPYTPAVYFAKGKQDPAFRSKLVIARQLIERARQQALPFRAAVADSFYGEDRTLRRELRSLRVPYVLALKPSHAWWHPEAAAGTLQDVAHEAGPVACSAARKMGAQHQDVSRWEHAELVGRGDRGRAVWAREDGTGHRGHHRSRELPDASTWYLVTNLPAPTERLGTQPPFAAASLQEVIRLYGLRMWVEQSRHPGQAYPGVVEVTSEKRSGDPAALAVGVVRLLVLLVSCEPLQHQDDPGGAIAACAASSTSTRGSGFESRNGEKKSARKKGSGHECLGHWHCGQCAGGWSPGSCCVAIGAAGRHCPHPPRVAGAAPLA